MGADLTPLIMVYAKTKEVAVQTVDGFRIAAI
jgi:hypothetical protein